MTFLVDLTDERFKIPANLAVIEYIRRANPFAHSDIGAMLIQLAKLVPVLNTTARAFLRSHMSFFIPKRT
jgi:hypothetical protein